MIKEIGYGMMEDRKTNLAEFARKPYFIKGKKWLVYKIRGHTPRNFETNELRDSLKSELNIFFSAVDVAVIEHEGALWLECCFSEGLRYTNSSTVYAVQHPNSPYLFVTKTKKTSLPFILQSLCATFGANMGADELNLKGKDLKGLTNIALNQLSLGAFSEYRNCTEAFDSNPLQLHEAISKRRRIGMAKKLKDIKDQEVVALSIADEQNTVGEIQRDANDTSQGRIFSLEGIHDRFNGLSVMLKPSIAENICASLDKGIEDEDVAEDGKCSKKDNFYCYVNFGGRDIMKGFNSLQTSGLVSNGKDLPESFDPSEIVSVCNKVATGEISEVDHFFTSSDVLPLWTEAL